jgi:hypothetical protein
MISSWLIIHRKWIFRESTGLSYAGYEEGGKREKADIMPASPDNRLIRLISLMRPLPYR